MNAELPIAALEAGADKHPKPTDLRFTYGTAGFRTLGSTLDSVLYRVGVLAALRSKAKNGKTIGVMITASHNPEADNGVKLVDPEGQMLEQSWEAHATVLANAQTTADVISILKALVSQLGIDLNIPAKVVYARDTRPSGVPLVQSFEDGLQAMGAEGRNAGVTTTPILHYLVRTINDKGTKDDYGVDSEEGYHTKLATAFQILMNGKKPPLQSLIVDCANGVGTLSLNTFSKHVENVISFAPVNIDINTPGALNNKAGADFVKTQQRLPPSLEGHLKPGQRAASFDGDADRLMYYYVDEKLTFRMLDGDKIAALVAEFIVELVNGAGLEGKVHVGIVQTAYANGASTKYLEARLPVVCVPTGVKHLHHAAQDFGIGVYFEANGHGTVLFSPQTLDLLASHNPTTASQKDSTEALIQLTKLINSTVGDALSDLLLVEVVLAHKGYDAAQWDSSYTNLPNRLVKVLVPDRSKFKTTNAERTLVEPASLQAKIDEQVARFPGGRSFVRASGTEDAVRVYAEASSRADADTLAFTVAGIVYDSAGGDPSKRPAEFI